MDRTTVDVAIIGAGTAGRNAQREVEKAGRNWLLIEGDEYGTTCARTACMPSKLLVTAADVAHQTAHAAEFGILPRSVEIDGHAVMNRVRRLRDDFVDSVVRGTEDLPKERRPRGHARFTGPTTLRVGDDLEVAAKSVVIATGSVPTVPQPFSANRDELLTSETIFDLETLPESLAVVGTGPVGLELGQAFSRLGVKVAFFSHSRSIGPLRDPRMRECAVETLRSELDLRLGTTITSVSRIADGFELNWRDAGHDAKRRGTFARVLIAVGRTPDVERLNLKATGLPLDRRGLPPWNPWTTQCADAPIFLAGDVNGHRPLLHEAADEGRIAGRNAACYPEVISHFRRTGLTVVFTDPQMAVAGAYFDELDLESIAVGEASWNNQGRARIMAANRGLVRLYARREDQRLLGAELFGPRVEHMGHLLAWTVQQHLSVEDALQMPVYHPVLEEGLRTAFRDLARNLGIESSSRCQDWGEVPGT